MTDNVANVTKSGRASKPSLKQKAAESTIPKQRKNQKSTGPKDKPSKKSQYTQVCEESKKNSMLTSPSTRKTSGRTT